MSCMSFTPPYPRTSFTPRDELADPSKSIQIGAMAMARRRTLQWTLSDLLMATLLCGLFAALARSMGRMGNAALLVLLMIWIVRTVWSTHKATRMAVRCEECGRTFLQTAGRLGGISLLRSGQQQRGWLRSLRTLAFISWNWVIITLTLFIILDDVILRNFTWGMGTPPGKPVDPTLELLAISIGLTMLVFFSIRACRWYSTVRSDVAMKECGIAIGVGQDDPRICLACELTRLGPDKARRVRAKVIGTLLLDAVLGILIPPVVVIGFLKSWWSF